MRGIESLRYELGEPNNSECRRPVAIEGSEFEIDLDNDSNPLIRQTTPGLETNKWGNIVAAENGKSSIDRIYVGGDLVLGAATVILAMGEGRKAAAMNEILANS